jgi:hypothetical protein
MASDVQLGLHRRAYVLDQDGGLEATANNARGS